MEFTIPKLFDMHVHLRQDKLLRAVTPFTARVCAKALIMPNPLPPIRTGEAVRNYKSEIQSAADPHTAFEPLMTFKIVPDTDPSTLDDLKNVGAIAGKVYPKGLTTHAEDGVEDYFALAPVFRGMEDLGTVLCLHGEKSGKHILGRDRERAFLRTLFYIVRTFPRLRIVLEHITTAAAVDAILQLPDRVAATITVHHLLLTHDDVGCDRMHPNNYCKPVAKDPEDREALIEAAISGCPKFFFGSDSAPHPPEGKARLYDCCAGIFTAPVMVPLLAEIFERHHALDRLEAFTRSFAAKFYGLIDHKEQSDYLRLVKEPWIVPERIGGIVPFHAGKEISWRVQE